MRNCSLANQLLLSEIFDDIHYRPDSLTFSNQHSAQKKNDDDREKRFIIGFEFVEIRSE